ncbi:hypothetical protein F5880DRAFT_1511442 [Lentinula raphanica]|nr:hypothetical protein F5880DRAFT_1511442 [Lentinula raphanica]
MSAVPLWSEEVTTGANQSRVREGLLQTLQHTRVHQRTTAVSEFFPFRPNHIHHEPPRRSNTSNNNVGWRPTSGMNGMISNDDDLLVGEGNGGFDQELATLMSSERSTASSTASTGSTASSSISSSASSATTTTGTTNDYVHRTHNILDMGITVRPPSSSQTQSQSPSLPHSQTHNLSQSPPLPSIPTHFNSTLPALNSSMRYEPLPDSANANNSATNTNKGGESPGLSQTAHNHTPLWGGVTRHTPSPHPHAATSPSRASHPYALSSRSRSRSRQPSVSVYSGSSSPSMGGFMMSPGGGNGIGGVSGGGGIGAGGSVGLQRRRRERRGNNVWSMTSVTRVSVSPPLHGHGRGGTSSAIVIPRHEQQQQGVADGWFGSAGSQGTTGFANLSLNVSNLHNHPNAHNAHSHTHMGSLSSPLNTVNVGGYPGQGMIGGIGNINTNTNNNNPNNTTNASNTSSSFTQNGHWPSSPSAGGDTQQFGLRTPCYRSIRLPLVQEDPVVVEARIRPPPPTLLPPPPLPCEEAPPNSTTSLSQTKHPRRQRRRRRESHNAVERRRRDNINEKIGELATMIPDVMFGTEGGTSGNSPPAGDNPNENQNTTTSNANANPLSPISPISPTSPSLLLPRNRRQGETTRKAILLPRAPPEQQVQEE